MRLISLPDVIVRGFVFLSGFVSVGKQKGIKKGRTWDENTNRKIPYDCENRKGQVVVSLGRYSSNSLLLKEKLHSVV